MKSILLFLFFIGSFLILSGVYEQKLDIAEQNKKIEYRFIPRTYYEEQMNQEGDIMTKYGDLFKTESPWYDRTIGSFIKPEEKNHNIG